MQHFSLLDYDVPDNHDDIKIDFDNFNEDEKEKLLFKYLKLLKKNAKINGKLNEDLLQKFIEIMFTKAIDTYDSSKCFSTWLNQIILNEKSNFIRRNKIRDHKNIGDELSLLDFDNFFIEENPQIEDIVLKQIDKNIIKEAIQGLKPSYCDIIKKYFGINNQEHTTQEIADIHNCSQANIYVKLQKALKILELKFNWKSVI